MSTSTTANEPSSPARTGSPLRLLREGYGPGAWHGADMKAAVADVDKTLAFWRPGAGRHNVAEIATHHAYVVRSVRSQLSGQPPEPFLLAGEDWFDIPGEKTLSWRAIQEALESEHTRLSELVEAIDSGPAASPLSEPERLDLVLGVTCHAVYHAGQIQLIKRLREDGKT